MKLFILKDFIKNFSQDYLGSDSKIILPIIYYT